MDQLFNIVAWLKKHENTNLSLFNFIQQNPVYSARRIGDSVLVRGISDLPWVYIQSGSKEELDILLKEIRKDDNFFGAIDEWIVPHLTKHRKIIWDLKTNLFVLPDDKILPEIHIKEAIHPLSPRDASYMFSHSHYKSILSKDYLEDRILKDYSAGITVDGKLAAWIITHDDGAIGSLHVVESCRKKGYGTAVTLNLIRKMRADGRIPFAYIDVGNHHAEKMAQKLGFVKKQQMSWLCLN